MGQKKKQLLLSLFLAALMLFGAWRMARALQPDPLAAAAEEAGRAGIELEMTGTVRDIRAMREGGWKTEVRIDCRAGSRCTAVVYTERLPGAEPGDRVLVSGVFRAFERAANPGQFDRFLNARASGLSVRSSDAEICLLERRFRPLAKAAFRLRVRLLAAVDAMSEAAPFAGNSLFRTGTADGSDPAADREARWHDSCAILAGMFLGERALIPDDVRGSFSAAGIAHMLAISGLHVSLIGMRIFRSLKKRLRLDYPCSAGLAAAAVFLYCLLTGFTASSVRALVMFSAMVFGEASSRPYDMTSAMSLAGLILCTVSPLQITQAGFQLSFLSAAAIAAAVPAAEKFTQASERERAPVFGVCLQTVTLPAVTAHWFRVPVAGIFLNPAVVPALPFAAGASFAAATAALVSPAAGAAVFVPVHLMFEGLRLACGPAEAVPFLRFLTGQPSPAKLAVCAAGTIAAVTAARKIAERDPKELGRRRKRLRFLGMIALFLVMTAFLQRQPSRDLRITFLDVGQGDGIFVEFPSGATALIDCGSSDVGNVGRYRLEPFLDSMAREEPDMVFLSHLDEDHVNGFRELAEDGRSPRVFLSAAFSEEKRAEKEAFIRDLEAMGIPVTLLTAGDAWTDRSGAQLRCVLPGEEECVPASGNAASAGAAAAPTLFPEENDTSLVLLLTYGDFSALFTGDIGAEREAELTERLAEAGFGVEPDGTEGIDGTGGSNGPGGLDVLKAAHHGSAYSTGEEFLAYVRPELAVISCGRENRYGHPAAETLNRLEAAGARTVVTAEYGCVIVEADETGITDVLAPYHRRYSEAGN